jgi:hypothetical protein
MAGVRTLNEQGLDLSKSQVEAWKDDLRTDIECAERQAANGPYFPEKGITAESLTAYAAKCRAQLADPVRSLHAAAILFTGRERA